MNLTANAAPAPAHTAFAAAGTRSAAGPDAASSAARPAAAPGATRADSVPGRTFTTSAALAGRSVRIPVSVDRHARETHARPTSLPLAVDPTAARTAAVTIASAKAGRGRLAAASQWDR
jgi:hypothetical protein